MARYDSNHKAATRDRIIEVAGRRLKTDGIEGSGIATLMQDAGLTNGAFYAHFASKDELVAIAIGDQLATQRSKLMSMTLDGVGIREYVRAYLSADHRDDLGDGCPSAALLDEIGRASLAVKAAYGEGIMAIVDDITAFLEPDDPPSARVRTLGVIASMIGTMQMARALADPVQSDALLEQGIKNAIALLARDAYTV